MRMKSGFSGLLWLFILSGFLSSPAFPAQTLSGTVKDGSGKGINGATVQLVVIGKSTLTDSAGNWQLDVSSSIQHQTIQNGLFSAEIRNGTLALTINRPRLHVKISLHKLDGTLLDWVF